MRVREVMSSNVKMANPEQSIRGAARLMAELDCGCLPVGEEGRLVGMITATLRLVRWPRECPRRRQSARS
jgi:CBS domain-containing protein